jgi:hypothetical protein
MTQITTATTRSRAGDRPPILSALAILGLNHAALGRLFGISTMAVSQWATGDRPIPLVRHLALLFLVTRLTGVIDPTHPPQTRYARRAQIAVDAASRWCNLARDELDEDQGSTYRAEDIERGQALGQRMLDRLEAQ